MIPKSIRLLSPQLYQRSVVLSSNRSKSLTELVSRIRRFDRDSIVLITSALLWKFWLSKEKIPEKDEVFKFYSIFIATIALAKCAPKGRPNIDFDSFQILLGEMFENIHPDFLKNSEVKKIEDSAKFNVEVNNYHELDYQKNEENTRFIYTMLIYGRSMFVQWFSENFQTSDLYRPIAILREFERIAIEKNKADRKLLDNAEIDFFHLPLKVFLKSIWIVFAKVSEMFENLESKNKLFAPPRIFKDVPFLSAEEEKAFGVSNNQVVNVLARISVNPLTIRKLLENITLFDDQNWMHRPEVWILTEKPVIFFDDSPDGGYFLIPSPSRLLKSIASIILTEYFDFLEHKSILNKKDLAYNLRGEGYGNYLSKVLSKDRFENLDIKGKANSGKCDFVWDGQDSVVLIEAKFKIRSNVDRTFLNPNSIVTSWTTGIRAIRQAAATIKSENIKKKAVLIILTDEALAEQTSQFVRVAKKFNFLVGSNIDAIAVCRTIEMEYISLNRSPDEVYESITKTWDNLNPEGLGYVNHDYLFFNSKGQDFIHPLLKLEMNQVFPGLYDALLENKIINKDK